MTFALLLARTAGIDFKSTSLHDVGSALGAQHSLMGRALLLLTDDVAVDFKVTLDLLVAVVGAVQWNRIRAGRRDVYLYLYEEFLGEYDDTLRKASGTYYTPRQVVDQMVRLTQAALTDTLGVKGGFAADEVLTIDPAMGTGTFIVSIMETVRAEVINEVGQGAVPSALSELAARLAGFEIQMGPYAVAELRVSELLAASGAAIPNGGLKLFVTDTLDDPTAAITQIASGLQTIARSRRQANVIKLDQKVTVVLGNPPYRELAAGAGAWVEHGSAAHGKQAHGILEDFKVGVPGNQLQKLGNLYVYFWRWATWKVWESIPADEAGVVCFITTSGYLTGTAFTAMRRYLRQRASHGWIIDLTPEGQTPDVPTRIFPGVRQPLAVGIFVRSRETDQDSPAELRYVALTGRQTEKFEALAKLSLDSPLWRPVRTGWTAPFTAAAESAWDSWPSMAALMPWYSPGVFPTRTWVYSPSSATLNTRWTRLAASQSAAERRELLKDPHDSALSSFKDLPGFEHPQRLPSISEVGSKTPMEPAVRVGYRAFDRQHVIADPRLIHRARAGLWAAALVAGQVFVVEMHQARLRHGPALVFSSLLPDFHYFKGSEGGRTLPVLHPDSTPNLAVGLADALGGMLGIAVTAVDVLAYVAGVVAHPAYVQTFAVELETPGIRVPLTADPELWTAAVELGRTVLWVHTYGNAFWETHQRPEGDIAFPKGDSRRISNRVAVSHPLSVNVRRDAHHRGIIDLEGENGERRTCWRRARMELELRLRVLPPAAETSLA